MLCVAAKVLPENVIPSIHFVRIRQDCKIVAMSVTMIDTATNTNRLDPSAFMTADLNNMTDPPTYKKFASAAITSHADSDKYGAGL
jgi:hypothetical protein